VAVVYAGQIIESGSKVDIFDHPTHPYTIGLFGALPKLTGDETRLHPIDGMTPDPTDLPQGCKFSPRCPHASDSCRQQDPAMTEISPGHFCRCSRLAEISKEKEGGNK
jgi:peptide/nickel transport system ATP-binding protein